MDQDKQSADRDSTGANEPPSAKQLVHDFRNVLATLMLDVRALKRTTDEQARNADIDQISRDLEQVNEMLQPLLEAAIERERDRSDD